jgi:hypothetical protein
MHAGQVHAGLVHQVLDEAKPAELFFRVDPHAPDRARRPDQPEPLVLAQGLRMHVEQPRRHADKVQVVFDRHGCVSF